MKHLATSLLLLFISFSSNGQKPADSSNEMEIAYVGCRKQVILPQKYPCDELTVLNDNGIIKHLEYCFYLFTPKDTGICNISAFDQKKRLIWNTKYEVKFTPNPEIEIANSVNEKITQKNLLQSFGLKAELKDSRINAYFNIEYYEIELTHKKHIFYSKNWSGFYFSEEMKKSFKKLKKGDKIIISNVKVRAPGDHFINLDTCEFTIID